MGHGMVFWKLGPSCQIGGALRAEGYLDTFGHVWTRLDTFGHSCSAEQGYTVAPEVLGALRAEGYLDTLDPLALLETAAKHAEMSKLDPGGGNKQ
eukprot:1186667-Prorocentrum_minimum.AAC.1